MGDNLIIEGEKFLAIFSAIRRFGEFWGGSEYTEYKYDGYWYEGTAVIVDKSTREKYVAALKTSHFREAYSPKDWSKDNYTLEESIVNFYQKGPFYGGDFKPQVVDGMYKKIADISLGELVSQIKETKEHIPTVTPKKLKVDDLVELGYCAAEDGQINIAFS